MVPDSGQPTGALVVDAAGGVSWWSFEAPALALVDLAVGRGVTVQVDAARPSTVLAWTSRVGGDDAALAEAFADSGFVARLADLRSDGENVGTAPSPSLSDRWVRRALVSAVSRWSVRPIHEGALILDEAASEYRTGHVSVAARLFTLAAPSLMALGEHCADGGLGSGPAGELADILQAAVDAAAGSSLGESASELAARLSESSGFNDVELGKLLTEWDLATAASQYASVHYGEGATSDLRVDSGFIDVRVIPPRIIAWEGADFPDLLIEYDAGNDRVLVSTTLATGVDPLCWEAQRILTYSSDAESGALQISAPMVVHGRALVGELPCAGRDPDEFHFGVFYAGTDLATLRTGRVGRLFIDVDRLMVDAWNHQRAGMSALYAVQGNSTSELFDDAQRIFQDQIRMADDLASDAEGKLHQMLDTLLDGNPDQDPIVEAIEAKLKAIAQYIEQINSSGLAPQLMHPLLAEMLSTEDEEDVEDR